MCRQFAFFLCFVPLYFPQTPCVYEPRMCRQFAFLFLFHLLPPPVSVRGYVRYTVLTLCDCACPGMACQQVPSSSLSAAILV